MIRRVAAAGNGPELTSFGLGKGLVQVKDHLVDEVADVVRVATADKQLPVVRKAIRSWFGLQGGLVANFDKYLYPVHPSMSLTVHTYVCLSIYWRGELLSAV